MRSKRSRKYCCHRAFEYPDTTGIGIKENDGCISGQKGPYIVIVKLLGLDLRAPSPGDGFAPAQSLHILHTLVPPRIRERRRFPMKAATVLILALCLVVLGCSDQGTLQATSTSQSFAPSTIPLGPCDPVMGAGQTFGTPTGFAGSADLVIRGVEFTAQVTTILLGPIRETDDGTLLADTSHTFDLGADGTFVTVDKARLVPTAVPGVFRLNSTLKVTEGADKGNLTAQGTITLIPGQEATDFDVHGSICGFGN